MIRRFALPVVATLLVGATLAVTAASGGGDYVVMPRRDPCTAPVQPRPTDLDRLGQAVVLQGLDEAACDLHTTREQLLLGLATGSSREELARDTGRSEATLIVALRRGFDRGVATLDRAKRLPTVSSLLPSLLDQADLPGFLETIARKLPDDLVDGLLPTGPTLRRAVSTLDFERLLDQLDDQSRLETALRDAIIQAAVAEARERLVQAAKDRSGPLGGILDDILPDDR